MLDGDYMFHGVLPKCCNNYVFGPSAGFNNKNAEPLQRESLELFTILI